MTAPESALFPLPEPEPVSERTMLDALHQRYGKRYGNGDMSDYGSGEEPERCLLEAVARFWWDAPCGHAHAASCYCAEHRDSVLRALNRGTICCATCDGPVTLLRMEPLR